MTFRLVLFYDRELTAQTLHKLRGYCPSDTNLREVSDRRSVLLTTNGVGHINELTDTLPLLHSVVQGTEKPTELKVEAKILKITSDDLRRFNTRLSDKSLEVDLFVARYAPPKLESSCSDYGAFFNVLLRNAAECVRIIPALQRDGFVLLPPYEQQYAKSIFQLLRGNTCVEFNLSDTQYLSACYPRVSSPTINEDLLAAIENAAIGNIPLIGDHQLYLRLKPK